MIIYSNKAIIQHLQNNEMGIIPTDTVYGLVTLCKNTAQIQRIYQLKQRPLNKPPIILVANWQQANQIGQFNSNIQQWLIKQVEPTSVVVEKQNNFPYSQQIWSKSDVALRIVKCLWLQKILLIVGPIIATSCNLSRQKILTNWKDIKMWKTKVDFIMKKPCLKSAVSQLYHWKKQQKLR